MFPSVVGYSYDLVSTKSFTLQPHADTQVGDLLLVFWYNWTDSTFSAAPTGCSSLGIASAEQTRAYYRWVDEESDKTANITFTLDTDAGGYTQRGVIVTIRGAKWLQSFSGKSSFDDASSDTTPTAPSVTADSPQTMLVFFGKVASGTISPPSGFTRIHPSSASVLVCAHAKHTSVGTTGGKTGSCSSAVASCVGLIAVSGAPDMQTLFIGSNN